MFDTKADEQMNKEESIYSQHQSLDKPNQPLERWLTNMSSITVPDIPGNSAVKQVKLQSPRKAIKEKALFEDYKRAIKSLQNSKLHKALFNRQASPKLAAFKPIRNQADV